MVKDADPRERDAQLRSLGLKVHVRASQGYARTFEFASLRLVRIPGAQCRIQQVLEGLLRCNRHAEFSWHCPSSPQRDNVANVPWATFAIAPLDDPRCRPLPNAPFLPCFNANELMYKGRARTRQGYLLLLDFRGLPGMEGSPVLNAQGELCAVLLPSLHCQSLGASLWFAVPINMLISAIASSCIDSKKPSAIPQRPLNLHDRACIMSASDVPIIAAQCRADPVPRWPLASSCSGSAAAAQRAVAMVRIGASWGSAVVIDADRGLLLTVAHLFEPRKPSPISSFTSAADSRPCHGRPCTYRRTSVRSFAAELGTPDDGSVCQVRWTDPESGCFVEYKAKLVHMFTQRTAMDVALIEICATGKRCNPSLRAMGAWEAYPLTGPRPYRAGNAVTAVGHSLIGPGARLGPMVTFGCLSCAMEPPGSGEPGAFAAPPAADGLPSDQSMLMTDCLVHSGCSGGALVLMDEVVAKDAVPPGQYVPLLGLITSNAAIQNGPVVPSIGFAVPATQLRPIFEACTVMRERPQAATEMLAAMDVPIQTTSKL